jgi:transketolase
VVWDGRGDGRLCLVSVGEVGTELCLRARRLRPELSHAHLCFLDHPALEAAAAELAAHATRFLVVEEHRPAGGIASSLALLLADRQVHGVNAGQKWPTTAGSHEDVLADLGLDLPAVLAAAERVTAGAAR